jgi:hypothetical protein
MTSNRKRFDPESLYPDGVTDPESDVENGAAELQALMLFPADLAARERFLVSLRRDEILDRANREGNDLADLGGDERRVVLLTERSAARSTKREQDTARFHGSMAASLVWYLLAADRLSRLSRKHGRYLVSLVYWQEWLVFHRVSLSTKRRAEEFLPPQAPGIRLKLGSIRSQRANNPRGMPVWLSGRLRDHTGRTASRSGSS